MVTAVGQQGHQDVEAPEVDDLLAELIADSQAGQGAAEITQDAGVVGECCRWRRRKRWGKERENQPTLRASSPGRNPESRSTSEAWPLCLARRPPVPGGPQGPQGAGVGAGCCLGLQCPLLASREDTGLCPR